MEILIGILCGLVLSLFFSFGPGFWGLIQNSIHYGFRKGVAFEAGVNFSDIVMVVLLLTLFNKDSITTVLRTPVASIIGGSVVIIFGLFTILRRPTMSVENKGRLRVVIKKAPRSRELVLYGFALNTANPSVWLYWAAMTAVVKAEVHFNDLEIFMFFISMLLAELAGGILKCRLASMLHNILSPKVLTVVNRIMGAILISLGIYLIVHMVVQLRHPERPEKEPTEVVTQIIHQSLHPRDSVKRSDTIYFE
ncbi:MAG: LysE family transporter [Bacteroidales bacterium]|nr:LysE family transporter [Bacteroidales bacterium]